MTELDDIHAVRTMEAEQIEVVFIPVLLQQLSQSKMLGVPLTVMTNLQWLIPLAADTEWNMSKESKINVWYGE